MDGRMKWTLQLTKRVQGLRSAFLVQELALCCDDKLSNKYLIKHYCFGFIFMSIHETMSDWLWIGYWWVKDGLFMVDVLMGEWIDLRRWLMTDDVIDVCACVCVCVCVVRYAAVQCSCRSQASETLSAVDLQSHFCIFYFNHTVLDMS
jgi:hypothetical protein